MPWKMDWEYVEHTTLVSIWDAMPVDDDFVAEQLYAEFRGWV